MRGNCRRRDVVIHSKKQKHCGPEALNLGDCWIAITLAKESGLILSGRLGKHTDAFLAELVANTQGKTDCQFWNTDDWGGYERVLPPEVFTRLTRSILSDWSAPMASFASKRENGIDDKTNLASFGSKLK